MCNGWIKIHRKMVDWEWYSDTNTFRLFFHLLLTANSEDKRWQGIVVKRGQVVISYDTIAKRLGLSIRQARTSLAKLISTNEITKQTTNRYTLVTICKYEDYQQNPNEVRQAKSQAERQANDKQTTSNLTPERQQHKKNKKKEDKEEQILTNVHICSKKSAADAALTYQGLIEEKFLEKQKRFYESLIPYVGIYGRELIRAFYDYWSEPNKSHTKIRMELERTWDVKRRLATWAKNSASYERRFNQTSNGSGSTKAERDAEWAAHVIEKLSRPDDDSDGLPPGL